MSINRLFIFFFIILTSVLSVFSQVPTKTDSLIRLLEKCKNDTIKITVLNKICWNLRNQNTDSAIYYGEKALKLSEKIGVEKGKMKALSFMGVAYRNKGNFAKALELYFEGMKISGNAEHVFKNDIFIHSILIFLR